jgi:LPXTG-motif cell wall-anchored protein
MNKANLVKLACVTIFFSLAVGYYGTTPTGYTLMTARGVASQQSNLLQQSPQEAEAKSAGCVTCHTPMDAATMHESTAVRIGCTDCHGGDATAHVTTGTTPGSSSYEQAKNKAHVQPRFPDAWGKKRNPPSAANPVRSYTLLNRESPEFVRFVNPGDLRVAHLSCGVSGCHVAQVANLRHSLMTHGGMLWGAALYNNGAFPLKNARFGESYGPDGSPQRLMTDPPPTKEEFMTKGVLPFLDPLPRWEISQPGNVLRVFERGGRRRLEVGNPDREEEPGKPDKGLSPRGLGTLNRTDPVFLGLQKTRLLDPTLSFMGTNDHPGDYRSSGCTACHVIYANDRSNAHSGPYARFGNLGHSFTSDPTINPQPAIRNPQSAICPSGHPIKHVLTRSIPSSQCIVCHVHPGTTVTNSYYGFTWWDNESDGEHMYPKEVRKLTPEQIDQIQQANPEGAAVRGLWSDPKFLADVVNLNPKLKHTQFADFHGHGWVFRGVYKQDRKGNLLDAQDGIVSHNDPDKFKKAVHLQDIHLEKGMHCSDCHFAQDNHGDGKLYGEVRNAIEIACVDCHGTINKRATLLTSGPAAPRSGTNLAALRTPWGQRRFEWRSAKLFQRSTVNQGQEWEVVQVMDTITPGNSHYNEKSQLAKTIRRDGKTWGGGPASRQELAHADDKMTCFTCHTSWVTSCFGCHLPMTANEKKPMLHNEGEVLRNWTSYNFQTLRDDIFMLGKDGTVTGRRVAPIRSACAVLVSSQNQNREWIYSQQQTVSAEGYSGQAFSPFVPHTVRAKETKTCTDCHVSAKNDNNAWIAQVLMQGTNLVNFLGRYVYVGEGHEGFEAVVVTERDEPQAVIGSTLHQLAYPNNHRKHKTRGDQLKESYHHPGKDILARPGHGTEVLGLQLRGEYLYTANGQGGVRVYDVAQIDQKGFSERVVTAPVSPLGQKFYVKTKYATAIASPSTMAVDPTRPHRPENEEAIYRDDKQGIHLLYAFLYATDKEEGLIVIGNPPGDKNGTGVATLLDGNPTNNFITRAKTFNPNGILNGAVNITIAGVYAYISCDRGVVVVSLDNPLEPRIVAEIGAPYVKNPRAVAVQFRYAFVVDSEGLKVIDVTFPEQPRVADRAIVRLGDARGIYVARTYAYIAAGKDGLAVVDVERPEEPKLDQMYTANGEINDAFDVKVGMTNASVFAYVADGKNGLRVIQLTSPDATPGYLGFSPRPAPALIATYHTHGPAVAISKGLDRDRAVDESGNQLAVFGRRGARPFNLEEMQRMYLRDRQVYTVTDETPKTGSDSSPSFLSVSILLLLLPLAVMLSRRRKWRVFRSRIDRRL